MFISDLKEKYVKHDGTRQIAARLQNDVKRIYAKGLVGSAAAMVTGCAAEQMLGYHLFLLPDKEEAAYFLNDLENLFDQNE